MSSPFSTPLPPLPKHTRGHCACKRTWYRLRLDNLVEDLRLSAYCHCTSCQRLNGAPFIWTTHWAERAVKWYSPPEEEEEEEEGKGGIEGQYTSVSLSSSRPTAKGGARLIPLSSSPSSASSPSLSPSIPDVEYTRTMAIYEVLPSRKWKQRCDFCGTPLGSWNQAKRQWSIWPSTLAREYLPPPPPPSGPLSTSSPPPPPPPPVEGLLHPAIQSALRAQHHQFWFWRSMDVPDHLPKWDGYAGLSRRADE